MAQSGRELLEEQKRQTQQASDNLKNQKPEILQALQENAVSQGASDPVETALGDYYTLLSQCQYQLQVLDHAVQSD